MDINKKPKAKKRSTIEKILGEALELHEKGVSLHTIVRTYPEHTEEIEDMFRAITTLSLEKEKIPVPMEHFEKMLQSLPELGPKKTEAVPSPFTRFWSTIHYTNLKYVLPIAAIAILTGSLIISKHANPPIQIPASGAPFQTTVTTPGTTTPPTAATPNGEPAAAVPTTNPSAQTPGHTQALSTAAPSSDPVDQAIAAIESSSAQESSTVSENNEKQVATSDTEAMSDPTQSYEN